MIEVETGIQARSSELRACILLTFLSADFCAAMQHVPPLVALGPDAAVIRSSGNRPAIC